MERARLEAPPGTLPSHRREDHGAEGWKEGGGQPFLPGPRAQEALKCAAAGQTLTKTSRKCLEGRAGSEAACIWPLIVFLEMGTWGEGGRGGHWRKEKSKHKDLEETTTHCTGQGHAGGQRTVTNRPTDPFSFQKGVTFSCHDASSWLGFAGPTSWWGGSRDAPRPRCSQALCVSTSTSTYPGHSGFRAVRGGGSCFSYRKVRVVPSTGVIHSLKFLGRAIRPHGRPVRNTRVREENSPLCWSLSRPQSDTNQEKRNPAHQIHHIIQQLQVFYGFLPL